MKKKIVIPVVAIMVMAMAGTAMARGGYHGGEHNGYNNGPRQIFEQLTPEKQKEVETIFQKHQDEFQTIKSQMWAKRTELNALVDSGKADQKTISKLVKEMVDLRTKAYNLRKQVNNEIQTATGIEMPMRGFGGGRNFDDDGPRKGHRHNNDYRGCWNS
ncbi:Spy/CpxP family protein refolding chaperone [Maridesulfovibrio salexigens]|uniref:Zinc resistance-associated protein n=1 Tax=Maridesulfovibrio salexigens (strain ATCC 14822 / DSM 2638 / NCIMB 8403 / VKM B-1763) TaxID=526222 RepID=C6BYF6_MARSD|nr:Spy/CpxP family protein refolding chaperone [Maridesulfovibrio salexigens]ACS78747.1 zinc resistance-associated protein [Maridesulfovibrio salexigens DSM 2638]